MSTWAAEMLGHYPGRCHACGWHIEIQGHEPNCPTNGGAPNGP